MCTQQSHAELKRDAARWATELDPIGEMDLADGETVVLANCRHCRSTLAVPHMQLRRAPPCVAVNGQPCAPHE